MSAESLPDVLIIGGGVIGLSTAYFLARSGATVTVLDQGPPGQEASWAGAGMLPPGNRAAARSPIAQLRSFSHELWKPFSRELLELTGINNGFLESGGLEISFDGEGPRLQQELQQWQAEQVPAQPLELTELRQLEPAICGPLAAAYRLPTFCQVRNPRHMRALMAACQIRGVRVLGGMPVTQLESRSTESHPRTITAVHTPTARFQAGKYLLAGGAWSGALARHLGLTLPVRPVRGQIVLLSALPLPFRHVINQGPRYLVPRDDGHILIGATEEEVGFVKQNTVAGVASLLEFARSVVPSLAQARIERTWAGLRPGSPRGEPYLSALPGSDNGYVAAGHFRNGLQQSVASGQLMAEFMLTGRTTLDLDSFRLPEPSELQDLH